MKFLAALIYFFLDVDLNRRNEIPKPKPNEGRPFTNGFPVKNQKGFTIIELLIVIVIIGIVLSLAMSVWNAGEKNDLETCKEKYGSSYTLGHSSANSSIKWCESPDGVMKTL